MDKQIKIAATFGAIGSTMTSIFGVTTPWIQFALWAMLLDYATGMGSAAYLKQLSSKVGFKGLAKKLAMIGMIALAFLVDGVILEGTYFIGFSGYQAGWLVIAVCFALIANEAISILENLGKFGIELPILSGMVKSLKDKADGMEVFKGD